MPHDVARRKPERKLPIQQLSILAVCRFSEPLASTSLLPYLPEMIKSFGIPDAEVGRWTGVCAATFSLCQATMGVPWGRASDRFGRKPAILLGLIMTMITALLWGFSTTLWMAIVARAISGLGNGNVGIIRTTVAEMVPYKELQPRAFSIMPLVWNMGSIFGPTLGGALANPLRVKPGHRTVDGSLLERYPYALPNIVSALVFSIGIITGFLFLEETLEIKRGQRDWGLILGRQLTSGVKGLLAGVRRSFRGHAQAPEDSAERERFIKPVDEESIAVPAKSHAPPPWKDVLRKQTILNLLLYTGLAMHNMAFDQTLPVYMSYKRPAAGAQRDNFLHFAGGFGLDNLTIGMLNAAYAVYGMLWQFLLFPPIARKLGTLSCMRMVAVAFPIVYLMMPFTLLMPTLWTQVAACFVLQLLKETCAVFAFPCSTILLTNTASSLRILGTINGLATSMSAVGRAAGPALTGALFDRGNSTGYLIIPWWSLAGVALLAAIPAFAVEEGKGFGDDEDEQDVDEDNVETTADESIEAAAETTGAQGSASLRARK